MLFVCRGVWYTVLMKKNDRLQVYIEGYSSDGHGVAKPDGFVLFVPGALDGETVEVHVVKVNKNFGYAKLLKVVVPSPHRTEPLCDVCDMCGGCAMWHADYSEEKRFKRMKVCQNLYKAGIDCEVDEVVSTDKIVGYRNKAQYPVRSQNGKIAVGFYRSSSHTVIEGKCQIQPEIFDGIAQYIKSVMPSLSISAYDESTNTGSLRHIYLRANCDLTSIMVCLVVNGTLCNKQQLAKKLTEKFCQISSVLINYNDKNTNVILSDRYELLFGKNGITDILLKKTFEISPQSFYQVNHDACEKLYSIAGEYIKGAKSVLDLYCGIGTVGICTADKDSHLTGVEIVKEAIENAKINAKLNGMENCEFYAADASQIAGITDKKFDAIIVDPPRKGCDSKTLDYIIDANPERLVYISCDSATLARDLKTLTKHFKIERVTPVDMFPKTHHVECVVGLRSCNN